ncbi:nuclear transport factor 2A [Striga hermonthica]|uniref:Nuclear transport factor 2A n=1 Tax=Striga hermonthica TaxID=68872 RepID=A0A9N7MQK9_STRHE|nr:nuclear transport factor 2A [Striga hermonthica]
MASSKKNPQQTVLLVQNRKQVLVVWWVLHAGEKYEKSLISHYTTFDSNLAGLANMYQEGSMLTFEGEKIMGAHNIVASRKPICTK